MWRPRSLHFRWIAQSTPYDGGALQDLHWLGTRLVLGRNDRPPKVFLLLHTLLHYPLFISWSWSKQAPYFKQPMQSVALSKLHPSPYSRLMLSNLCPEQAKVGRQIHKTISISCYIQILTLVAVEYGCVKIMRNNSTSQTVTSLWLIFRYRDIVDAMESTESLWNMDFGRIWRPFSLYNVVGSSPGIMLHHSIKILTVCLTANLETDTNIEEQRGDQNYLRVQLVSSLISTTYGYGWSKKQSFWQRPRTRVPQIM